MPVIQLGNVRPVETDAGLHHTHTATEAGVLHHVPANVSRELSPLLSHTTTVVVPDEITAEKLRSDLDHLWSHHSLDVPGWITAENPDHEDELRNLFGIPRPAGPTMLLTNAGLDFFAAQAAGTASATAVAKWIALTANSTAPAAADTTLTGEIATASGGLIRAAATYAHTAGATTYTLTNTFTSNVNDALPVTIAKVGNFNATSAGSLVFETLLGTTATLSAVGDSLALTWTITL